VYERTSFSFKDAKIESKLTVNIFFISNINY